MSTKFSYFSPKENDWTKQSLKKQNHHAIML